MSSKEQKTLHLVADTNLFFEFKKLEELPWSELGVDQVVILVAKPVLDEIDKHKKGNGRTRDRAMNIFQMLRTSLKAGGTDTIIHEESPRVVLRHIGNVTPNENLRATLDFQKNDDRLVAILSTLVEGGTFENAELFTDDTGPVSTAQGLGLPFRFIDDEWRRPPEQTEETKRIKALEKDLATYRSQEPDIKILHGETVKDGAIRIVSQITRALTSGELNTVIERIKLKHPQRVDFSPPPSKLSTNPITGAQTEYFYESPSQDDIDNYRNISYPNWLEDCRKTLATLHDRLRPPEKKAFVSYMISNEGTRPATQVRIEFKTEGQIALIRSKNDDEDDDEDSVPKDENPVSPAYTRLPSPPQAPSFVEIRKEIAPPRTVRTGGLDIASLGKLASSIENIHTGSAALRAAQDSLRGTFAAREAIKSIYGNTLYPKILDDQKRLDKIINPSRLGAASAFSHPNFEIVTPRIDYNALKSEHDSEAFYFDEWQADVPVKSGALTCDLWRHKRDYEVFEFEVVFTKSGDAGGSVICTIHAENLTEPATSRIAVRRKVEDFSVWDRAIAIVDQL